jgi:putative hydrolase of the HAD superfamily
MARIKAVFLDVDDTLVDYAPAARAAFAAALGEDASYEQWLELDHYERWLNGEFDDFQAMRDARMADFLRRLGRDEDVRRAGLLEQLRFDGLAQHYRLFDDASPCLDALRAHGLLLGLITNNESVHQRDKLRRVGLDSGFDATVISGELGVAKPNAAIFEHACELVGVEPAQALHVGDNLVADAQGAHGTGLHGVWLDRRGEHDNRPLDVAVIRGLDELPRIVVATR